MFKVLLLLLLFISLLLPLRSVFALEMPFTDIRLSDPYYNAVGELYQDRIISDNGDHLFRPGDLMNRDFFVSLAVEIGCHECETPSVTDILKYQTSPFVDLTKINPHYYCIAYAKEEGITQGYIVDASGKATCENQQQYMSSPFCANNTISRIEAVAMLLRRAKLWNDTLNSGNFDKSLTIGDVTSYWYGYAKKGIEVGIIQQKSDGTIAPDAKITRGEFAMMAAHTLRYTQCQTSGSKSTIESTIGIKDTTGNFIQKSNFRSGESFSPVGLTQSGSWNYNWKATNSKTGQAVSGSGEVFPGSKLGSGSWIVTLDIIDPNTTKIVSSPTVTLHIGNAVGSNTDPSLVLSASTLTPNIRSPVSFTSIVGGSTGTLVYSWNYGDGNTSSTPGNTNHTYTTPGIYPVTLTITDKISGKVAQSTVIIRVGGDIDTDGDGIIDTNDGCPLVYAKTPTGCPIIDVYNNANLGINGSTSNYTSGNICLNRYQKSKGLLIGIPNCTQCPCNNTISIDSPLRSCDIVFPTILSPTLDTVYSRGGFYLIP